MTWDVYAKKLERDLVIAQEEISDLRSELQVALDRIEKIEATLTSVESTAADCDFRLNELEAAS